MARRKSRAFIWSGLGLGGAAGSMAPPRRRTIPIGQVRNPYSPLVPRPPRVTGADTFRTIDRRLEREADRERDQERARGSAFRAIDRNIPGRTTPTPRRPTTSTRSTRSGTRATRPTRPTQPRTQGGTRDRAPAPTRTQDRQTTQAARVPGVADDPYFTEDPSAEINNVYRSAFRALEEERRKAREDQQAREQDMQAFNQWVETGRLAGVQRMTEQQAQAQQQFSQATADANARLQSYVDAARGRNANIANEAGTSAVLAAEAAMQPAALADQNFNTGLAFAGQQRLDAERGVNEAAARNAAAMALGQFNNRMADATQAGTELETSRARDILQAKTAQREARLAAQQADRQFSLDQQAAEYLRQKGAAEFGLSQFNAETERLKVTTQAQLNSELNKIRAQYNQGRLTQQQADRQARVMIADARLQEGAKDRAQRRWQTIFRARNTTPPAGQERQVASDLASWVSRQAEQYERPFAQIDRHNRGQIARNAASYLASIAPNMTVEQAVLLLGSQIGQDIIRDPEFRDEVVLRLFR